MGAPRSNAAAKDSAYANAAHTHLAHVCVYDMYQARMHAPMHACMHACIHAHTHAHPRTSTHMHAHARTCTVHTTRHADTHARICAADMRCERQRCNTSPQLRSYEVTKLRSYVAAVKKSFRGLDSRYGYYQLRRIIED